MEHLLAGARSSHHPRTSHTERQNVYLHTLGKSTERQMQPRSYENNGSRKYVSARKGEERMGRNASKQLESVDNPLRRPFAVPPFPFTFAP